jgi:hypothetical protein
MKTHIIRNPRLAADRSVGQLLEEMDKITARQNAIIAEEKDVKLMSDYKSPRSPRSPGKDFVERERVGHGVGGPNVAGLSPAVAVSQQCALACC